MLSGTYYPSLVEYGAGSLKKLPAALASLSATRAFIITGHSIKTKTPIIDDALQILAESNLAVTQVFSGIKQHAPIAEINEALRLFEESRSDVVIAVGGGSPIDSAKLLTFLHFKASGARVPVVAVPTTLSVAETTPSAGYSNEAGQKVAVVDPQMAPRAIIYDANLLQHTPPRLLLSSGLRALDHAFETLYHPTVGELPYKPLALSAIADLFRFLPVLKRDPADLEAGQALQIAGFLSLFPRYTMSAGLGLSHSLGHALGATYGIPHGITSCITLATVLHWKADTDAEAALCLARALPFIGVPAADSASQSAHKVADALADLVESLGLTTKLSAYNVPVEDAGSIASHALGANPDESVLASVTGLVKTLY